MDISPSNTSEARTPDGRCVDCNAPIWREKAAGCLPLRCGVHRRTRKNAVDKQSRMDARMRQAANKALPDTIRCADCTLPVPWDRRRGGRAPERCLACRQARRQRLRPIYHRGGKATDLNEALHETPPTARVGQCAECGVEIRRTGQGGIPRRCPEHRAAHTRKLARESRARCQAKKQRRKGRKMAGKPARKTMAKRPSPTPTPAPRKPELKAKPMRAIPPSAVNTPAKAPESRATPARSLTAPTPPPEPQVAPRGDEGAKGRTGRGTETREGAAPAMRTSPNGSARTQASANGDTDANPANTRTSHASAIRRERIRQINAQLGSDMTAAEMIEMGLKPFQTEWWE